MNLAQSKTPLSRPNFFPGQSIDYRDFNRLAQQAFLTQGRLCQNLYPEGGIFSNELQGLNVIAQTELKLTILPGTALLPNGQILQLPQETLVDLGSYLTQEGRWVIFGLTNQAKGVDPFEDQADPSIQGYCSETHEAKLVVGQGRIPNHSTEIFRVYLSPQASTLRNTPEEAIWKADENPIQNDSSDVAFLDLRFRKKILSPSYFPIPIPRWLELRQLIFQSEDTHRQLKNLFLTQDDHQLNHALLNLHASLLEIPFQSMKVSFLATEVCDRMARFLEDLSDRVPRYRSDLDRKVVESALKLTEQFRKKKAIPEEISISKFKAVLDTFVTLGRNAQSKLNYPHTIQAALEDKRNRHFQFQNQEIFAGFSFRRVDYISASDPGVQISSEEVLPRKLTAVYKDGKRVTQSGLFIPKGRFTITFNVLDPTQSAIIVLRHYERRQKGNSRYLLNGKTLENVQLSKGVFTHRWKNLGWLIPAEQLIAENNQLTIRIEDSDLDFGFFGFAIYQSIQTGIDYEKGASNG